MDGENKFWIAFWSIAGTVVIAFSLIIYASHKHEDNIIEGMVEQGHSPIEARCAFANSASDAVCIAQLYEGDK